MKRKITGPDALDWRKVAIDWASTGENKVVMPEYTFEAPDVDNRVGTTGKVPVLEAGKVYSVNLNGEIFKREAFQMETSVVLGNPHLITSKNEDNGDIFVVAYDGSYAQYGLTGVVGAREFPAEHTISVSITSEGIDMIPAGTPMSEDGKIANDGSAYGILMEDVLRKRNSHARVIISGIVDRDEAEAQSGIALSEDAIAAMPNVLFIKGNKNGDYNWKALGLPYSEGVKVVEILPETELTLEEDGMMVPGLVLNEGATYFVKYNGVDYTCVAQTIKTEAMTGVAIGNGAPMGESWGNGEPFAMAWAEINGGTVIIDFTGAAAITVAIVEKAEVIYPIDPKYLPKGIGGVTYVNVTAADVTTGEHTLTADAVDKSYAEIFTLASSGAQVGVRLFAQNSGMTLYLPLCTYHPTMGVVFTTLWAGAGSSFVISLMMSADETLLMVDMI